MSERITPYSTTYSGRHISIESGEPAILDIAVGLSRMTRFGGQGKQFFSVLAHMLWMDDLYRDRTPKPQPGTRLAILLHDANEAVTADIPSPLKGAEQKGIQRVLDERIFNRYFSPYGGFKQYDIAYAAEVKTYDHRALLTEFWEIGPAHPCYLDKPDPADRDFFRYWMEKKAPLWQSESEAQDEYIMRLMKLL